MNPSPVRNIWMVSREYGDLAGAGGIKDVVKQLAESLVRDPLCRVSVVVPRYGFVSPEENGFTPLADPLLPSVSLEFRIDMNYGMEERNETCRVWMGDVDGVRLYLIEADRYGEKTSVYTYTDKDSGEESWRKPGMGHYDYFAMNVLLQKSSLELMVILGELPDVIHCHDGHTALVPALIRECQGWRGYFRRTGCLVTIHNAGIGYHQDVADLPFAHGITGLRRRTIGGNRLAGKFDPFLAAGQYAILNTVSENYARELQKTDEDLRTDWLGHELLQRGVTIEGITNGINPDLFNPVHGVRLGIKAAYAPADPADRLEGKVQCKKDLIDFLKTRSDLKDAKQYGSLQGSVTQPLFTFIGRLSEQKGVDLFLKAIEQLFAHNAGQAVILGSGSEYLEAGIVSLTEKKGMNGKICFLSGYSPELANQVYAAGDFFVIPSRYEPCGLTDYIAQLYGAVPIVHHVGGLVKVVDGRTGITYNGDSVSALYRAFGRALDLYRDKTTLRRMQRQAVELILEKHTWDVVMREYMKLYEKAIARRAAERQVFA
jgi:starch synthase